MNKALIVVAHPDDEALGCGATIAKHTKNGDKVQVVFVADGFSSREVGSNRCNSAKNASKILGCISPIFFEFSDNKLDTIALLDIIKKIEQVIESFQPSIIYTHHFGDLNVDHQITHRAVMTACRPQPNFCVKEIYSFETLSATHWQSSSMGYIFNPNYFIDATEFMDLKIKALECYNNEIRDFPHSRSYESVKNLAKFRGSIIGVQGAEAFIVERLIK
jgi:LmbE family N-acetylglucosaminyl deacetylase